MIYWQEAMPLQADAILQTAVTLQTLMVQQMDVKFLLWK